MSFVPATTSLREQIRNCRRSNSLFTRVLRSASDECRSEGGQLARWKRDRLGQRRRTHSRRRRKTQPWIHRRRSDCDVHAARRWRLERRHDPTTCALLRLQGSVPIAVPSIPAPRRNPRLPSIRAPRGRCPRSAGRASWANPSENGDARSSWTPGCVRPGENVLSVPYYRIRTDRPWFVQEQPHLDLEAPHHGTWRPCNETLQEQNRFHPDDGFFKHRVAEVSLEGPLSRTCSSRTKYAAMICPTGTVSSSRFAT